MRSSYLVSRPAASDSAQDTVLGTAQRRLLSLASPAPAFKAQHYNQSIRMTAGFFSQFGKVTKVRLSRNKRSGKAKHYAFLEFQYPEVCRIAAEAMDGYFMFKQKITCSVVPAEKLHPDLFRGANRKFKVRPKGRLCSSYVLFRALVSAAGCLG